MASNTISLIVELVNKTESEFKAISTQFDEIQKKTSTIQSALTTVGVASGIGFGVISAAITKSVSDFGAFNTEIQRSGAFVNANAEQLKAFSNAAIEAVKGTKFSFLEGATALENFVGGEVSAEEASANLGSIIDLALVTKVDNLQDAVNLGSLALTVFQKDGMQTSDVIDIMASVTANVTSQTQSWSTALVDSAGSAKVAGLSFKDLNVLMATMVRGGENVTHLGADITSAMNRIAVTSPQAATALDEVGLSGDGLRAALQQGVIPALEYLRTGFDKAGTSGGAFISQVLGQQAAPGILAALGLTNAQLEETSGWFENITGKGAELVKSIRASQPPLQQLTEAFATLSLQVGGALSDSFNKVIGVIAPLILKISDFATANPQLTADLLLLTAAALGLTTVLTTLGLGWLAVSAGMGALFAEGTLLGGLFTYLNTTTVSLTGMMDFLSISIYKVSTATFTWAGAVATLESVLLRLGFPAVILAVSILISLFSQLSDVTGGWGNAFSYMWDQLVHNFDVSLAQLTGNLGKFFGIFNKGWGDSLTSASKDFTLMASQANTDMDNIVTSVKKPGPAAGDMSAQIADATKKINAALAGTGISAKDAAKAAKDAFDELVSEIKSTRDEIDKTFTDIQASTDKYLKGVGDENKSYQDTVVDTVAKAEISKTDLVNQVAAAQADAQQTQADSLQKIAASQADAKAAQADLLKKMAASQSDSQAAQSDLAQQLKDAQAAGDQSKIDSINKQIAAQAKADADKAASFAQQKIDLDKTQQDQALAVQKQTSDAANAAQAKVDALKKQVDAQTSILNTYYSMQSGLDSQVEARRVYLSSNELQREQADHTKKLQDIQDAFLAETTANAKKLEDQRTLYGALNALVAGNQQMALAAELAKADGAKASLEIQRVGLAAWFAESQAQYGVYVNNVNSTLGQIKTSTASTASPLTFTPSPTPFAPIKLDPKYFKASGGSVDSASSYIVGENGPELFTPAMSGSISPTGTFGGGTSLTINITGNNFVGRENIAQQIANDIAKIMKQSSKL